MERFNILFENFKTIVEQYVDFSVVVYGAVALGILIVVGMVVRSFRLKALKKSLQEAETRFQSIKSTPLLFKLNKAVALARVNDSVNQAIDDCKVDFETVQEQIKTCSAMLGEVDDLLYVRKRKAARNVYNKLDAILSEVEAGSARVLDLLDDVLQQENIQREQINVQKEEFRALKKEFVEHANLYNDAYTYIETKLLQVEKMFSTFEEWMFASEFNKASEQQQEIIAALAEL
ncbi:MAG: septation ring formation regulator EzrA, partial [Erysipelotrichaceae bacterium]